MLRYCLTAYYEDKATEAQVAQRLVVIAEDDASALRMAKDAVAPDAAGGRVATIEVSEKARIEPSVVYRGDPYIPFRRPAARVPTKATGGQ